MKVFQIILLLIVCSSCSNEPEFYSSKSFKSLFINGLFLSKLAKNKIPYQLDSYMGEEYVLVHSNFKKELLKLRKESSKEGRLLISISLENKCSQRNLAHRFKVSEIYSESVVKGGIPAVRITQKDKNSKSVINILNEYEWRCN